MHLPTFALRRPSLGDARSSTNDKRTQNRFWPDEDGGGGGLTVPIHKPYLTRSVSSCLPNRNSEMEVVEETFLLQDMKWYQGE